MDKFGDYPFFCSELPISKDLKENLERLIKWHDEALNWDNPGGALLWSEAQVNEFLSEAKNLYLTLCKELPDDYEIEFINHMWVKIDKHNKELVTNIGLL